MDVKMLNCKEMAARLNVSTQTVMNYIRSGKMPGAVKIGGQWKVSEENFKKFMHVGNSNDKATVNAIVYQLFNQWLEEKDSQTIEEIKADTEMVEYFAKINGISVKSPLAMMYMGFIAGVGKGIEFVSVLEGGEK